MHVGVEVPGRTAADCVSDWGWSVPYHWPSTASAPRNKLAKLAKLATRVGQNLDSTKTEAPRHQGSHSGVPLLRPPLPYLMGQQSHAPATPLPAPLRGYARQGEARRALRDVIREKSPRVKRCFLLRLLSSQPRPVPQGRRPVGE